MKTLSFRRQRMWAGTTVSQHAHGLFSETKKLGKIVDVFL